MEGRKKPRGSQAWALSVLLAMCASTVSGTAADFGFEHLTIDDGLSQNTVFAMVQDHRGFLWFGTDDGLDRYDGYNLVRVHGKPNDPNSLRDNQIRSLFEDREGKLWIGTGIGGLHGYDPDRGTSTHYGHDPSNPNSLASNLVWAIHQTRDGAILAGTNSGLSRLDDEVTGSFSQLGRAPGAAGNLEGQVIRVIFEDRAGQVWLGSLDGLYRLDPAGGPALVFPLFAHAPGLGYGLVRRIYEDTEGILWLATRGGLVRFDPEDPEAAIYYNENPAAPDSLRDIYADQLGRLWLASYDGLLTFDPATEDFERFRHDPGVGSSLSIDQTLCLQFDRSGNLWVGTEVGGVNKLNLSRKAFSTYTGAASSYGGLSDEMVVSVLQDRSGLVWVGTRAGGLNRVDREQGKVTHYRANAEDPTSLTSDHIRSLLEDREGRLWVGTEGGGLHRFDRGTETFERFRHDRADTGTLRDDDIWELFEDSHGTLWVGTWGGGLSRFDRETGSFEHFFQETGPGRVGNNVIRAVHEDHRDGALWIGTGGGGLHRLDVASGVSTAFRYDLQAPATLTSNNVLSIHQETSGALWIGTHGGGLNYLAADVISSDAGTATFQHFTHENGLPSDVVYGILEDDDGFLWMSTTAGLARFDPRTKSFRNYDTTDGLLSLEFNGGTSYRAESGEMFFGGLKGLHSFFPDQIRDSTYLPPVVLTGFKKFNREAVISGDVSSLSSVTLKPDEEIFSFEFAALDYVAPERNRYAYKLTPFLNQWTELGTKRDITFTNLDPGDYTFRVRGSNHDGLWNEEGMSLSVVVEPRFWQEWWFKALSSTGMLSLVWSVYLLRTRNIRRHSRALQAEVSERRRIEESLQASERKYRELFEEAKDAIFVTTESGGWLEINRAGVELLGYASREELMKTSIPADLYLNSEDRDELKLAISAQGFVRDYELTLRRKDGEKIVVLESATVIREADGRVVGYRGILHDITDRRRLEEQLREAQRMEAVGQLAGGIAHDFNNLLTVIMGNSSLLDARTEKTALQRARDQIHGAAAKAAGLTKQLLAFGRRQVLFAEIFDLNDIVIETQQMLRRLIGEDIQAVTRLERELGKVRADSGQIEQVLVNLIINARDAMPQGGTLTIATTNVLPGSGPIEEIPVRAGLVCLEVSDTGIGIPEENRERVFEPFFTTKGKRRGTGLGMSTAYGIVKQSGGTIELESEVGRGTTFRVYLPRVDDDGGEMQLQHEAGEQPPLLSRHGSETVLLVEDEESVRGLLVVTLEAAGYRVLEAEDGERALSLIADEANRINLIITDIVMPGMSGYDLVDRLPEAVRHARILFISGYSDDTLTRYRREETGWDLLYKPFTPSQLTKRVRQLLEGASGDSV